jgi:hypothetical protein
MQRFEVRAWVGRKAVIMWKVGKGGTSLKMRSASGLMGFSGGRLRADSAWWLIQRRLQASTGLGFAGPWQKALPSPGEAHRPGQPAWRQAQLGRDARNTKKSLPGTPSDFITCEDEWYYIR